MPKIQQVDIPFTEIKQGKRRFYLSKIKAKDLVHIAYASVRNKDDEPGAVQRVLNPSRISDIKEFTLNGGDYPNSFILNWNSHTKIKKNATTITIALEERSAQIIDGQHRIAGIRAAIAERKSIGNLELSVSLYEGLTTPECADIFLSINTEQKTVPRSLVYDLYGISSEKIGDNAIQRARDVAYYLNEYPDSPYNQNIKLPGVRSRGGIALSTVVSSIKPLVAEKGELSNLGIDSLESQKQVILNYFNALSKLYGSLWDDKRNAFNYGAGFTGAIEFFSKRIIPECNKLRSFETEIIAAMIKLSPGNLILQEEIKGKGGSEATQTVFDRLVSNFSVKIEKDKTFKY